MVQVAWLLDDECYVAQVVDATYDSSHSVATMRNRLRAKLQARQHTPVGWNTVDALSVREEEEDKSHRALEGGEGCIA